MLGLVIPALIALCYSSLIRISDFGRVFVGVFLYLSTTSSPIHWAKKTSQQLSETISLIQQSYMKLITDLRSKLDLSFGHILARNENARFKPQIWKRSVRPSFHPSTFRMQRAFHNRRY
jgi:hypothetical protein